MLVRNSLPKRFGSPKTNDNQLGAKWQERPCSPQEVARKTIDESYDPA